MNDFEGPPVERLDRHSICYPRTADFTEDCTDDLLRSSGSLWNIGIDLGLDVEPHVLGIRRPFEKLSQLQQPVSLGYLLIGELRQVQVAFDRGQLLPGQIVDLHANVGKARSSSFAGSESLHFSGSSTRSCHTTGTPSEVSTISSSRVVTPSPMACSYAGHEDSVNSPRPPRCACRSKTSLARVDGALPSVWLVSGSVLAGVHPVTASASSAAPPQMDSARRQT